jgi:catechol 2,3-dioxygenase-like lactoylglutathione lyase family enzyme
VRLNHLLLWCADVARSLDFYEGRLNFVRIEAGDGYARLRAPDGDTTIGLHAVAEGERPPWNEGVWLYLEVEDVDSVCRRLAERGVTFDRGPEDMGWGWRHAYLRDPDGHRLSIYHAGARRFQPTPGGPA